MLHDRFKSSNVTQIDIVYHFMSIQDMRMKLRERTEMEHSVTESQQEKLW